MTAQTRSHVLISELGKTAVDPDFSKVWSTIDSDIRRAISVVALHYCSAAARFQGPIIPSGGPQSLGKEIEGLTEEACAVLSLIWLTDGKDFWLVGIEHLAGAPCAAGLADLNHMMNQSLASFGDKNLVMIRKLLGDRVQQAKK